MFGGVPGFSRGPPRNTRCPTSVRLLTSLKCACALSRYLLSDGGHSGFLHFSKGSPWIPRGSPSTCLRTCPLSWGFPPDLLREKLFPHFSFEPSTSGFPYFCLWYPLLSILEGEIRNIPLPSSVFFLAGLGVFSELLPQLPGTWRNLCLEGKLGDRQK